ncbi:uncharacterized protein LOC131314280 isoform X3 [Rhododendron vialii]|uniref:uncharacterized protein LOC131314280 isoform X3 n=1 Tax=Rhododendron vialii TaxID=182163 RepID=UPI00265E3E82|nr:uncharacterized protein LOC131314280 isoform X3 [Rhododendron vialii]XP_058198833.1 uncharacterized protein LOC131314280 isoform X3 [Rhododendron vialii]XP_058198841.1 uncharacterized protein LOC131314280 isoform X3 [Rhododendron vialii]
MYSFSSYQHSFQMLGALQEIREILLTSAWNGNNQSYAASLGKLDRINLKFPNESNGVFVENVIGGSPAECAGILSGDVIVPCAGSFVQGVLEFYGIIWDKCGESVEVVVLRSRTGDRLNMTLKVGETSSDKINRWPLPERCRVDVKRVR